MQSRHKQCDVRECLRKIPNQALAPGVIFLRKQTNIVCQLEKPLEEAPSLALSSDGLQRADQPEAAGQKCAFAAGKAIGPALGFVAQQKAILHEILLNSLYGTDDTRIIDRKKSHQWD